jgi:hypothetical protein
MNFLIDQYQHWDSLIHFKPPWISEAIAADGSKAASADSTDKSASGALKLKPLSNLVSML